MTCGLVHASYSLPEWQAVKLTFFAPCSVARKKTRGLGILLGVSREPRPRPNCGWLLAFCFVSKVAR